MSVERDFDDDPDWDEGHNCMSCGGDGFRECDDWDCFHGNGHLVTCFNCKGSGDAKDQWF